MPRLVLTRKIKQKVMIGPNIILEVTDIRGNQVRLGITAPDNVKILREELTPHNQQEGIEKNAPPSNAATSNEQQAGPEGTDGQPDH